MLYFVMGIAIVIFWILFKRILMIGIFLVSVGAFYFSVTNNRSNLMSGAFSFMNSNKLEEVKNLVDQESQTVLSFYSTMSNKQDNLINQLTQLSNERGGVAGNKQVIQSPVRSMFPNKVKSTVNEMSNLNLKKEALLYAVSKGQVSMAEMLIKNQADVNAQDKYGRTPLMVAVTNCDAKMVKMLLANLADVNVRDNAGNTALIQATRIGYAEIFNMLISSSLYLVSQDNKDESLLIAAKLGRTEMVKTLIKNHADINAKRRRQNGLNALSGQRLYGNSSIACRKQCRY